MPLFRSSPRQDSAETPSRPWAIGYGVGVAALVGVLATAALTTGAKPHAGSTNASAGRTASASELPTSGATSGAPAATPGAKVTKVPTVPARATVRIATGDSGLTVSRKLAAAHVVKSSADFYQSLLSNPSSEFFPGTYTLPTNLSAAAALEALADPANRVQVKLVIPEGFTAAQVYARAAKATKQPVSKFTSAAKNLQQLGVPKIAPNVEGWLFPATYTFEPDASATTILRTMVQRTHQALAEAGLGDASEKRQEQVLTLASIVQKESGSAADAPKVARVFVNRIAKKMPLQSDATVSYGTQGSTVIPTKGEYASDNPYNTYRFSGLPAGPISNPGDVSIAAALHPASGSWLYFVTVNLQSGRTIFSTTVAEHDKAAAEFRTWLKAHPSYR